MSQITGSANLINRQLRKQAWRVKFLRVYLAAGSRETGAVISLALHVIGRDSSAAGAPLRYELRVNDNQLPIGPFSYVVKAPQIGQSVGWVRGSRRCQWSEPDAYSELH